MIDPLQTGVYLGCLALFLATVFHVVRGWRPTDWLVGGLAVLELALPVQLVVGIVLLAGDRSAEGGAVRSSATSSAPCSCCPPVSPGRSASPAVPGPPCC